MPSIDLATIPSSEVSYRGEAQEATRESGEGALVSVVFVFVVVAAAALGCWVKGGAS